MDSDASLRALHQWLNHSESATLPSLEGADADDETRVEALLGTHEGDALVLLLRFYTYAVATPLVHVQTLLLDIAALDAAGRALLAESANTLAARTWMWHSRVRMLLVAAKNTSDGGADVREQLVRLSWRATVAAQLCRRVVESCEEEDAQYNRKPLAVLVRAEEFVYVKLLAAAGGRDLALTDTLIGRYSVSMWSLVVSEVLAARAATGWTPSSHALLGALMLRYALLLQASDEDEGDYENAFDDPLFCPPQSQQHTVAGRFLTPDFVDAFERQLFPLLYVASAAAAWHSVGVANAPQFALAKRRELIAAWARFVEAVAGDDQIAMSVLDAVREELVRRQLQPGHVEQAARLSRLPEEQVDLDNALFDMQRDAYLVVQRQLQTGLGQLAADWAAAAAANRALGDDQPLADGDAWERAAIGRPASDVVMLLLVEKALNATMPPSLSLRARSFLDDYSQPRALQRVPQQPSHFLRTVAGKGALFLSIARCYVVIDGNTGSVATTPHLADALTLWLRAVGSVPLPPLHPALRDLLQRI